MTVPATSWFRRWFGWCWGWTMRCFVIRLLAGALLVALVAGGVATWWFFTTPLPGSHASTPVETIRVPSRQHQTPEGITYSVDAGPAIVALDMGSEDAASRRVFSSYAVALRHARANGLATMPSVPLTHLDCRALGTTHGEVQVGRDGLRIDPSIPNPEGGATVGLRCTCDQGHASVIRFRQVRDATVVERSVLPWTAHPTGIGTSD